MTVTRRVLLGVAVGALITLFLHPASRPLFYSWARPGNRAKYIEILNPRDGVLPLPTDLMTAGHWVQIGCERLNAYDSILQPNELRTLIEITESAAKREPQNAFWPQSRAVFLSAQGSIDKAKDSWEKASTCTIWNDYQSQRLLRNRENLAQKLNVRQAWQLAYLLNCRSDVTALSIERYARTALANADSKSRDGLTVRFVSILNGNLMRSGARSILQGAHGAAIVELSAYPSDLVKTPSPRRLWTGQTQLLDRMQRIGGVWSERSDRAHKIFRENEGWQALMVTDEPIFSTEILGACAILTSGITLAVAIVAVLGSVIWGASYAFSGKLAEEKSLSFSIVTAITVSVALLSQWVTKDYITTLHLTLCSAFLAVSARNVRKIRPESLGPLFAFVIGVFSIMFTLAAVSYVLGKSDAAGVLIPEIGIPSEFHESSRLLALTGVVFGTLLVVAPLWGIVQRLGTPYVLSLLLRRFGASLAIGGLALGIVLAPITIFADRELSGILTQLVGNEPLYHYIHQ